LGTKKDKEHDYWCFASAEMEHHFLRCNSLPPKPRGTLATRAIANQPLGIAALAK